MISLLSLRSVRTIALMSLAICVTGCTGRSVTITYKVTATVSDKGVLRSGSSVWKISIARPWVPLVSPYDSHFEWSPIQVPLSDGGKIIVRLKDLHRSGHIGAVPPQKLFTDRYADDSDKVALYRSIGRFTGVSRHTNCDYSKYRLTSYSESIPFSKSACLLIFLRSARGVSSYYSIKQPRELLVHMKRVTVTIVDVD